MARLSLGVSSWSSKIRVRFGFVFQDGVRIFRAPTQPAKKGGPNQVGASQRLLVWEYVQGHVIVNPYRDRLVALSIRVMGLPCFGRVQAMAERRSGSVAKLSLNSLQPMSFGSKPKTRMHANRKYL